MRAAAGLRDLWVEALQFVAILGARLGGPELPKAEQGRARRGRALALSRVGPRSADRGASRARATARRPSVPTRRRGFSYARSWGWRPGLMLDRLYRLLLDGAAAGSAFLVVCSPPRHSQYLAHTPSRDRLPGATRAGEPRTVRWSGGAGAGTPRERCSSARLTGDGALVLIAGEGGIGKTRLIAELATHEKPAHRFSTAAATRTKQPRSARGSRRSRDTS